MSETNKPLTSRSLSGLDTLVDLRSEAASSASRIPSIVFDPNRFRLERMLQTEHLVYGVPSPFLGREQEHGDLLEIMHQVAKSGRMQVASISGSPGSGKTRLLAEVFATMGALGENFETAGACCSESESDEGIAVVGQLLRRQFDVAPQVPNDQAKALVRLAIEPLVDDDYLDMATSQLGYLMGLDGPQVTDQGAHPEGQERLQTMALATCSNLLAVRAAHTPQVLVFHRAQYLTPAAHAFLSDLSRALAETPTLVLLLGEGPLKLENLGPNVISREILIAPLPRADMEALVRAILVRLEDAPAKLIAHIVNRSAGNPRLVEDNIRLLVQKGVLEVTTAHWTLSSDALDDALDLADNHEAASTARVHYLSPDMRHVLSLASVFGRTFWRQGLLTLLRVHPGGAPQSESPWISDPMDTWLSQLLEAAISDGIVRLHNASTLSSEHELSFSRPGDRETLYEAITHSDRARHHRLAAQWLAALDITHPAPWYSVIAEHWKQGEEALEAARWYQRAGDEAREIYDLKRAKNWYQHALALVDLDHVGVLVPALQGLAESAFTSADFDAAQRAFQALAEASLVTHSTALGARAWLMQGRTHRCLGDFAAAQHCYQHAETLYRRTHDHRGLADTLEQRGILMRLEGADGACEAALQLFEQCLELRQREGDVGAVAKSLENIASTHLQQGRLGDAQSGLEQALELRRQLGDVAGQAGPLGNMGLVRHALGDVQGAIDAWRTGLSIAERVGDRELVGIFFNNIGEGYFELGEHAMAKTALTDAKTITSETGDQRTYADVLRNLGALALARGDWKKGLAAVDEAIALCTSMGSRLGLGQALRTRGAILGHQLFADTSTEASAPDEATRCFTEALSIFDEIGDLIELEKTLRAYAHFLSDRGQVEESQVALERADTLRRARDKRA